MYVQACRTYWLAAKNPKNSLFDSQSIFSTNVISRYHSKQIFNVEHATHDIILYNDATYTSICWPNVKRLTELDFAKRSAIIFYSSSAKLKSSAYSSIQCGTLDRNPTEQEEEETQKLYALPTKFEVSFLTWIYRANTQIVLTHLEI